MFQIYKGQCHGGKIILNQEKTYDLIKSFIAAAQ